MLKAVILIGGPQKGTRFRPLSLQVPKPLFPVAGRPVIQHHIEACAAVQGLREVLILGAYPASELQAFTAEMAARYGVAVRYLQEYAALGTAGGLYQFRDQIRAGAPDAFFVLNGDVCGDFRLDQLLAFHRARPADALLTVMATEATRQQSVNFGCIAEDRATHHVLHYAEKPETFVSTLINTGIYICSSDVFHQIGAVFKRKQEEIYNSSDFEEGPPSETISLEVDILAPLAGSGRVFVYQTSRWWSQIKTASAALYSNRHYLKLYRENGKESLAVDGKPCTIIGDVWIHPTATIHHTAVLGPNVSVGRNAELGEGVRVREAIVLGGARVREHSLVLHAILGWDSVVGPWSRIEGTPCDPDPNKPFAKMDNIPLFNGDGKLNPSITILGCNVTVAPEKIVLNCIILPHKDLVRSYKNEILL